MVTLGIRLLSHCCSSRETKGFSCLFVFKTILGEIRDEDDEILPRKDYEVRFHMP